MQNRLKDKTEVLVFSAKDIGVVLDDSMSMVLYITAVCKSAFFPLRNINKIRKVLTTETTKTLLHAFVTSKIDYCNSLLYGAPKYLLRRLHSIPVQKV